MTKEQAIKKFEEITINERFINKIQFEELSELENVYYEDCGFSGTGKGTWVNFYYTDSEEVAEALDFEDERWEKIGEVIVVPEQ